MTTIKKRRFMNWLCAMLAAVAVIGIPAIPVYAAEPAEDGEHLETLYQRELDLLEKQTEHPPKTEKVVSRVSSTAVPSHCDNSPNRSALCAAGLSGFNRYMG